MSSSTSDPAVSSSPPLPRGTRASVLIPLTNDEIISDLLKLKSCLVPDCDEPRMTRGYCAKHRGMTFTFVEEERSGPRLGLAEPCLKHIDDWINKYEKRTDFMNQIHTIIRNMLAVVAKEKDLDDDLTISPAEAHHFSLSTDDIFALLRKDTASHLIVEVKLVVGKTMPDGFAFVPILGQPHVRAELGGSGSKAVFLATKTEKITQRRSAAATDAAVANESSTDEPAMDMESPVPSLDPITSVVLTYPAQFEEPPFAFSPVPAIKMDKEPKSANGFSTVDMTVVTNLTGGVGPSKMSVELSAHRSTQGAGLSDVAVVFSDDPSTLPPAYHIAKLSPLGHETFLCGDKDKKTAKYLAFRPNIQAALAPFRSFLDAVQSRSVVLECKTVAVLVALLYSYNEELVIVALDTIQKLHKSTPPFLIDLFIKSVCNAVPTLLTYFSTASHTYMVKWLLFIFHNYFSSLTLETVMRMYNVCFLIRHEDKQCKSSLYMIDHLVSLIATAQPCVCSSSKKRSALAAGGEIKAMKVNKDGSVSVTTGSPPSSSSSSPSSSSSLSPSSSSSAAPLGTCLRCQQSQCQHMRPETSHSQFVATLIRKLADQVVDSKLVEHEVKRCTRSVPSNSDGFFKDLAASTNRLTITSGISDRTNFSPVVGDQQGLENAASTSTSSTSDSTSSTSDSTSTSNSSVEGHSSEAAAGESAAAGAGGGADAGGGGPATTTAGEKEKERIILSIQSVRRDYLLFGANPDVCADGVTPYEWVHTKFEDPMQRFETEQERRKRKKREREANKGKKEEEKYEIVESSAERQEQRLAGEKILFEAHVPNKEYMALVAACLVFCKMASEEANFTLRKSERIKRKVHGLSLLNHLILKSEHIFKSSRGSMYLLSRFIVPTLISCCITDVPSVFRLVLQTFVTLYEKHKGQLTIELGVFFHQILLPLLESNLCTIDQRKDVMDCLLHLFRAPEYVVNLFYNYDNQVGRPAIYLRTIGVLSKIMEINKEKVLSEEEKEKLLSSTGVEDNSELKLKKHAMRVLVHLQEALAQWVGVPGIKRSPAALKALVQTVDAVKHNVIRSVQIPRVIHTVVMEESKGGAEAARGGRGGGEGTTANGDGSFGSSPVTSSSTDDLKNFEYNSQKTISSRWERQMTFLNRFRSQQDEEKVEEEALRLAKTKGVKAAVKYMKKENPSMAVHIELAKFLYKHDSLDSREKGDFLSSLDESFMTAEEFNLLRRSYMALLDFTGMTLDHALRVYLTKSGFFCPGEAQKVERMLECFCEAYLRDNPDVMSSTGSCLVLCFALVMLNTDHHNTKLKKEPEDKMTLPQFLRNLRDVNDGKPLPQKMLEDMFWAVAREQIKMDDTGVDGPRVGGSSGTGVNLNKDKEDGEGTDDSQVKNTLELITRKALATLKTKSPYFSNPYMTTSTQIVAIMWEQTWHIVLSAITANIDNTVDVELLHSCLDGIGLGAAISIVLHLPSWRQAFTRVLAQLTFAEKKGTMSAAAYQKKLVEGDHLKQDWYRPLNVMSDKEPVQACKLILKMVGETKERIRVDRDRAILLRIQKEFGGDLNLFDEGRRLVREGMLTKVNANSSGQQDYVFLLFNDILLYASKGMGGSYKIHRVMHLSLVRVVDLKSFPHKHAFKLLSPQKSIIVVAATGEKKAQWINAIIANINEIMAARKSWVNVNLRGTGSGDEAETGGAGAGGAPRDSTTTSLDVATCSSSSSAPTSLADATQSLVPRVTDDDLLRKYSTFIGLNTYSSSQIGKDGADTKSHGQKDSAVPISYCKLCIKNFTMFRRKQTCKFCMDHVCADCISRTADLPTQTGGKKQAKVCDACWGFLSRYVTDDTPSLTVEVAEDEKRDH